MSRYRTAIMMSCGHEQDIDMNCRSRELDDKIAWYTNVYAKDHVCSDCYKAQQEAEKKAASDAAAARAAEMQLPELTGTPKQVAWALTIRDNVLSDIDELTDKITAAAASDRKVLGIRVIKKAVEMGLLEVLAEARSYVAGQAAASYYIDTWRAAAITDILGTKLNYTNYPTDKDYNKIVNRYYEIKDAARAAIKAADKNATAGAGADTAPASPESADASAVDATETKATASAKTQSKDARYFYNNWLHTDMADYSDVVCRGESDTDLLVHTAEYQTPLVGSTKKQVDQAVRIRDKMLTSYDHVALTLQLTAKADRSNSAACRAAIAAGALDALESVRAYIRTKRSAAYFVDCHRRHHYDDGNLMLTCTSDKPGQRGDLDFDLLVGKYNGIIWTVRQEAQK